MRTSLSTFQTGFANTTINSYQELYLKSECALSLKQEKEDISQDTLWTPITRKSQDTLRTPKPPNSFYQQLSRVVLKKGTRIGVKTRERRHITRYTSDPCNAKVSIYASDPEAYIETFALQGSKVYLVVCLLSLVLTPMRVPFFNTTLDSC